MENLGQARLFGLSVEFAPGQQNPHGYIFSVYLGIEKNPVYSLTLRKPEVRSAPFFVLCRVPVAASRVLSAGTSSATVPQAEATSDSDSGSDSAES